MALLLPKTTTAHNHGLLIRVAGEVVGVTVFSPKQGRAATPVFEFGQVTVGGGDDIMGDSGEPYEIVPGNATGLSIDIQRYDVFSKRFEKAFRTNNLQMLTRQDKSISFVEFIASPGGEFDYTKCYYGCWFTSIGRNHDAKGDRITMVNATAQYARCRDI